MMHRYGKIPKYGGATPGTPIVKMFREKLAPSPSYILDEFLGSDVLGRSMVGRKNQIMSAKERFLPIFGKEVMDAMKEQTSDKNMGGIAALSFFGAGTQTYKPGKPTYENRP
jgi:hypothetical protein